MWEKLLKHSILLSVLTSVILGVIAAFITMVNVGDSLLGGIAAGLILGIAVIYPLVLTLINLTAIFFGCVNPQYIRKGKHFEWLTLLLGMLYSLLLFPFTDINFADWTVTLYNTQKHTPIWTEGAPTILILAAVGILGYLFLSCSRIAKVPPLITVLEIAAMYIGMVQCILWIIQIIRWDVIYLYLCLFPLNCILIGIKVIRLKVLEWQREHPDQMKCFKNRHIQWLNEKLRRSAVWPAAAFLLMWPLLGIIICILLLFGQQPDSAIRAWTETSDWNLSLQTAPQNIYYDEHYLCTVAAGGHRKVVKPIRMGVRHGHPVIVNRQLCVANAFEQILEERVPDLHRRIRNFYDRYGFPIAKLIRSPYAADVVYFIMKPLEWVFLLVIYATDVKPENRIAVQYLPKNYVSLPS
ncbi:MAG TPA: hypothetical protein H9765_04105 [Candidatus Mediterraneibacter intestinigallinarum]|nr:hypothetical protein [Candidatus Mediterraneibacter intestinigallinarum]